ncbi:MAG TPA: efflux RND transporter periplasmic adaptor subunit [Gemmatimonadales bacterium]|nr:efflux RND transporter periplasmic adaptor subunit [Gemmatimonadales bacterium]
MNVDWQATRSWLMDRKRRGPVLAAAGGLLMLLLFVAFHRGGGVQYLTAKVQRGEIRDEVDATGTVNAVITVQVGSQVSGTIAQLSADFNSRVHKGDIIALIDPSALHGALLQATADLENARASVVVARADSAKAAAVLAQAQAEAVRAGSMAKTNVITQQELDQATVNLASARAGADAGTASVVQARAQVSQKDAALAVARTNLGHTVIRSPIDGVVVARNVDVGQTVAASLQAPTIFTIAQDLTKMRVYAKVDESDVGRIRPGQPLTFKVDAYPKDVFQGLLSQIRMNPTTVQNVVTYDAVIEFENADLKLFPGMTAYVAIPVASVADAIKLPNAALRFRPPASPDEIRLLYARYGLDSGGGRGGRGRDGTFRSPPAAVASEPRSAALASGDTTGRNDDTAVVWKLIGGNTLVPVKIELGITDHAYTAVTAVLAGELEPGDDVVTTVLTSKPASPGTQGLRR